jgi:hypothetical protein
MSNATPTTALTVFHRDRPLVFELGPGAVSSMDFGFLVAAAVEEREMK